MKIALILASLLAAQTTLAHDLKKIAPHLGQTTLADGRSVVTDAAGRVVYTFDEDQGRESSCYDGCARAWPPLLLAAGSPAPQEPVSTTPRRDGTTQLTLDGRPLYHFIADRAPGDAKGDGVDGTWHVIKN